METPAPIDIQALDDEVATERYVLLRDRISAEAAWQSLQHDPSARLGQMAVAAVSMQDARIRVAAFERFHDLPSSSPDIDK